MAYIGNSPGVASQRIVTTFTATAGQTTFTPSSGYTVGYLDVYHNGVKLINGDDYTASNGSTFALASGAASGDVIEAVAYLPRGLSDGYTKAEADTRYVNASGDTMTGDLSFGDNDKAIFGTNSNLSVYANGGYSYIDETGANELNIRTNGANIGLYDTTNSQYLARFNTAGSAVLYYNGTSRIATQSDGAYVTGNHYQYPSSGSGYVIKKIIPRFTPNYGGSGVPGDWEDFYTPAIGESGRILVGNINTGGGEYRYFAQIDYSRASYLGSLTISVTEPIGSSMADFRVEGVNGNARIQIRNTYGYGTQVFAEITALK